MDVCMRAIRIRHSQSIGSPGCIIRIIRILNGAVVGAAPLFQTNKMHLMYYTGADGKRCYTLKKEDPTGKPSHSAHPARFSPDDKFSKERITTKKRFNLLPTQHPDPLYQ
ncbi:hypothetical protein DYB28_007703 [Aphanomyces astaci]|uniref:Nucleolar protein 10 n=1 Tax=Aphanomyces astaci TaxID=112090 RepID=A0A397D4A7_APHAT|nr:hypothetical protein DYB34_011780 [Aphanomyces astaci]RHY52779.1 hypothetical protein DYB38_002581 [Aphanomyces astaci]RHY57726.1 hypothetical protein DYB30_004899 [Aphanomyces astaci]RLO11249.1 hypothetical protein DYB28_007703 [Aphanomyces astaci]